MLAPDTRLGPYAILSSIGAGGMGEVYRARDSRLERDVAIKILPPTLAADEERLRRFELEARTVAALNHPNLLAVYDIGAESGMRYLVSELLEGETLRARLEGGPLPLRKALEYGVELALGLAAAHAKGITHRDLKPENIFLTSDARVKILDFGLAKAPQPGPVHSSDPDQTRTLIGNLTSPGVVLGTVGYMAPEQVRGTPADARSDIFALGVVLHEMLCGQAPFARETTAESLAAVLKDEPPELNNGGRTVPREVESIVRRCLEKNPEERFQSARDLAFALRALTTPSQSGALASTPAVTPARRRWPRRLLLGAGALVLAALGFYLGRLSRETLQPAFFQYTFRQGHIRTARFSPDGQQILFGAGWDGKPVQVFQVNINTKQTQALEFGHADLLAVARNSELAISLGSRFLGMWMPSGTLATAHPLGGARPVLEGVSDADWSPKGSGMAIARRAGNRFRLEFPAGKTLYETDGYVSHLRFSPDGERIAFMDHPLAGDDRGFISVVNLRGERRVLAGEFGSEEGLAWTHNGKEIYFAASRGDSGNFNSLFAVDLAGQRRVVLRSPLNLTVQDISRDGRILITSEQYSDEILAGNTDQPGSRTLPTPEFATPAGLSADGRQMLITEFNASSSANYDLFVRPTDGSSPTRIGDGLGLDLSDDGRWALAMLPADASKLLMHPTGLGQTRELSAPGFRYSNFARWFADGERLMFVAAENGRPVRTWVQSLSGGAPRAVTPEGVRGLLVSPDGSRIVGCDGQGIPQLYALDNGPPQAVPFLKPGETLLRWLESGREVLVTARGAYPARIFALNLETGARRLVKEIAPMQPAGQVAALTLWSADGRHYVHLARKILSTLFVVTGL